MRIISIFAAAFLALSAAACQSNSQTAAPMDESVGDGESVDPAGAAEAAVQ